MFKNLFGKKEANLDTTDPVLVDGELSELSTTLDSDGDITPNDDIDTMGFELNSTITDTDESSLNNIDIETLQKEITEQILAELQTVETEDQLHEKVQELNDQIGITDYEWETLYNNPETVGYMDRMEQVRIFEVITPGEADLYNDTFLDVGCGVGDYYAYLTEIKEIYQPNYTGIDYNGNMIEMAKRKYADISGSFHQTDFLDHTEKYDWIIAGAAFNIKFQDDMQSYVKQIIDHMYEHCNKGLCLDFISDFENDEYHQGMIKYDPVKLFEWAINKYKKVLINTEYLQNDFCIKILKDNN